MTLTSWEKEAERKRIVQPCFAHPPLLQKHGIQPLLLVTYLLTTSVFVVRCSSVALHPSSEPELDADALTAKKIWLENLIADEIIQKYLNSEVLPDVYAQTPNQPRGFGENKRFSEFVGKRSADEKRFSEFVGKRSPHEKRFSEFVGKRSPTEKRFSEFVGKRSPLNKRFSEFVGKRFSEFVGKRSGDNESKRFSEFVGK